MRVIAGSARRLLLKTVEGMDTRPTTDRIKETLFNILQPDVPGCCFLDLFSGSGAIAIEALSRGADQAVLVEKDPRALECIRANLTSTHLADRGVVMGCDVLSALKRLEHKGYHFDIIFMDPPYRQDWERQVLEEMKDADYVDEDTRIIIEASLDTDFSWLEEAGYLLERSKEYKTNKHVFVRRR